MHVTHNVLLDIVNRGRASRSGNTTADRPPSREDSLSSLAAKVESRPHAAIGALIGLLILAGILLAEPWTHSPASLDDAAARDRDIVEQDLSGGWTPQLASNIALDPNESEQILDEYDQLHDRFGALLVKSDAFAGMGASRWVVLAPVHFSTGREAVSWCKQQQLDFDHCFGRFVGHDPTVKKFTEFQRR